MGQKTLIIMVKYPSRGQTKTRLAADIGQIAALKWYRHHLQRLIHNLPRKNWHIEVHVTPAYRVWDMQRLAARWHRGDITIKPQPRGDLGAKMRAGLGGKRKGPVLLIGADIIGITPALLQRIAQRTCGGAMQIGPTPDGGYWLIGRARRAHFTRGFMHNIAWSTKGAMRETCASWPWVNWQYVQSLQDVDRGDDLAQSRKDIIIAQSPL